MSTGYGYSDASDIQNHHHHHHFLQSFHEPRSTTDHVYNLSSSTSTGMENIINGFNNPAKNLHTTQDSTITSWNHVSNIPCDQGNHDDQIRPTQGRRGQLSLSLSTSSHPSNYIYGLQSSSNFDLSQSQNDDDLRFGPPTSRSSVMNIQHHPQVMMQEHLQIRNSKYLDAAQELLNEFCNLGVVNQSDKITSKIMNKLIQNEYGDENAVKKQSLYSLDLVQLQKRKTKLLQMLQEVDRRYKHYCDQMKAVVQSFESVAGNGAARVYSVMASKAMSRHFRCLKDGILSQIKETKNAMGEKDSGIAGSSKGETPRLRRLDQTLRQQRAFQQMNMMETHPWRPQRGLPERAVSVLRAWLFEHFLNPYPSDVDKHILARQTGLSRGQVSNWFINARVRLWKPMVEEMYLEDLKESQNDQDAGTVDRAGAAPDYLDENNDQNPLYHEDDQKPTIRTDSECLSTIINNDGKQNMKSFHNDEISFGAMQFDFSSSSYGHHSSAAGAAAFSYLNDAGNGGGGVSLTLGLHQNGGSGGGVSLAFSPTSQSSLFYPREQMGDCQTVQFSLLDSENQNLQYRNLMGAQLLHDLAG